MLHTPPPAQPTLCFGPRTPAIGARPSDAASETVKLTDTDDAQPEKAEPSTLTTLSLQIRERLSLSDASGQTLPMMRSGPVAVAVRMRKCGLSPRCCFAKLKKLRSRSWYRFWSASAKANPSRIT